MEVPLLAFMKVLEDRPKVAHMVKMESRSALSTPVNADFEAVTGELNRMDISSISTAKNPHSKILVRYTPYTPIGNTSCKTLSVYFHLNHGP